MTLDIRTMCIATGAICFMIAAVLFILQTRQFRRDSVPLWVPAVRLASLSPRPSPKCVYIVAGCYGRPFWRAAQYVMVTPGQFSLIHRTYSGLHMGRASPEILGMQSRYLVEGQTREPFGRGMVAGAASASLETGASGWTGADVVTEGPVSSVWPARAHPVCATGDKRKHAAPSNSASPKVLLISFIAPASTCRHTGCAASNVCSGCSESSKKVPCPFP